MFHRIGPRVSPDRTFLKTNAPVLKRHPVFPSRAFVARWKSRRVVKRAPIDMIAISWLDPKRLNDGQQSQCVILLSDGDW